MRIRVKEKQVNMTIIQCYSPTNDSDDEIKDLFIQQLEAEVVNTTARRVDHHGRLECKGKER